MIHIKRTGGALPHFTAPTKQTTRNYMAWVDGRFIVKPAVVQVTMHQSRHVEAH